MELVAEAPDYLVARDSGVHGRGVYTLRAIAAGERVLTMGGVVIPFEQVRDDLRVMQIGHDQWLAEPAGGPHVCDLINHSCEPNIGFTDGSLVMYALRAIEAGGELLWDYSTSMNERGWSVPCGCGTKSCRGRIQSFCDLDAATQRRLRPIALRYLRT
jgi:SET domain-containing protein